MVSANKNGVSNEQAIIRNKDGSIRKQMGRKPQKSTINQQARGSVSEGSISHTPFAKRKTLLNTENVDMDEEEEEENVDMEIDAPVGRQVMNDFMNMTQEMFQTMENRMEKQANDMKTQFDQMKSYQDASIIGLKSVSSPPPIPTCSHIGDSKKSPQNICEPVSKNQTNTITLTETEKPRGYNRMAEICGYKMRIQLFNGGATEDYDVWWENLCAFFELYPFTEEDKVRLFNAHLGGEARKYVFKVNLRNIATVGELNEIFRKTFSDKYDWHNVLMNIRQKPDEQIRPYSIRLRIAATKCGFADEMLDKTCVNYLKSTTLPLFEPLMTHCLPNTPFDVIVEHAIQFERAQELKTSPDTKKPIKRKSDDVCVLGENDDSLEKKIKQDYTNTIKQIKDNMNSNFTSMCNNIQESVNSINERLTSTMTNRNTYNTKRPSSGFKRTNVCYYCAKPSHTFNECRIASPADRNTIANSLAEKKFDFVKLRERANALEAAKQNRVYTKPNGGSLNYNTPKQ
jgi:hypothetical protein